VVVVGLIWDPFRSHLLVDTDPFRFLHRLQHISGVEVVDLDAALAREDDTLPACKQVAK
jgi:hypothetical protein